MESSVTIFLSTLSSSGRLFCTSLDSSFIQIPLVHLVAHSLSYPCIDSHCLTHSFGHPEFGKHEGVPIALTESINAAETRMHRGSSEGMTGACDDLCILFVSVEMGPKDDFSGTTFVGVVIRGDDMWIANIGDSRITAGAPRIVFCVCSNSSDRFATDSSIPQGGWWLHSACSFQGSQTRHSRRKGLNIPQYDRYFSHL